MALWWQKVSKEEEGGNCLHRSRQKLVSLNLGVEFLVNSSNLFSLPSSVWKNLLVKKMVFKVAFYLVAICLVFTNAGLGRFASKFQSKMQVIERFEENFANRLFDLFRSKENSGALKVNQYHFPFTILTVYFLTLANQTFVLQSRAHID